MSTKWRWRCAKTPACRCAKLAPALPVLDSSALTRVSQIDEFLDTEEMIQTDVAQPTAATGSKLDVCALSDAELSAPTTPSFQTRRSRAVPDEQPPKRAREK